MEPRGEKKAPSRAELLAREKHKPLPLELEGQTLLGRITEIFDGKRYGFIYSGGIEYFFHASAAEGFTGLKPGDSVKFIAIPGKAGLPRAAEVTKE